MRLLALHIVFFSVLSIPSYAGTDLGVIGPTYEIKEEDFAKVIMERAKRSKEDGSWEEAVKEHGNDVERAALVADGGLPQARSGDSFLLDPTITVQEPIRRADGSILYDRGTKVNPLDYISFKRKLCFFDANSSVQIQWVEEFCTGTSDVKRIAAQGDIAGLHDRLGRVYLDQEGRLIQRFKLKELPSIVSRDGNMLKVEVFGL